MSQLSKEDAAKMVAELRKLDKEIESGLVETYKIIQAIYPSLFPGHFTGFVGGGSQKVEFYVGDSGCLKFGLHRKTTGRHDTTLSKIVSDMHPFPVSTPYFIRPSQLVEVKRKSPVSVQFKLKPGISAVFLLLALFGLLEKKKKNVGGDGGDRSKLKVTFSSKQILTQFLAELEKVQLIRKTGYGFLGLRTKWVPY